MATSKFTEIADRMKRMQAGLDQRADDLIQNMDKIESRAAEVFEKHEGHLAQAEVGFKEMENALRELAGGNNPPDEDKSQGNGATEVDGNGNRRFPGTPLGESSLGTG